MHSSPVNTSFNRSQLSSKQPLGCSSGMHTTVKVAPSPACWDPRHSSWPVTDRWPGAPKPTDPCLDSGAAGSGSLKVVVRNSWGGS